MTKLISFMLVTVVSMFPVRATSERMTVMGEFGVTEPVPSTQVTPSPEIVPNAPKINRLLHRIRLGMDKTEFEAVIGASGLKPIRSTDGTTEVVRVVESASGVKAILTVDSFMITRFGGGILNHIELGQRVIGP